MFFQPFLVVCLKFDVPIKERECNDYLASKKEEQENAMTQAVRIENKKNMQTRR